MYMFKGLTWIDIIVDNPITMHVFIVLLSSCFMYLGMFRLTNIGIAVFVTDS